MSDDNVTAFPGTTKQGAPPNAKLIAMLEDTLAMAKAGRLQHLIATGMTSDSLRYVLWGAFEGHDVHQMLGSIAWLEHEYVARVTGKIL